MTLTFLHPSLGLFIPKVGTATGPGTGGHTWETVFSVVHTGHFRVFTFWGAVPMAPGGGAPTGTLRLSGCLPGSN